MTSFVKSLAPCGGARAAPRVSGCVMSKTLAENALPGRSGASSGHARGLFGRGSLSGEDSVGLDLHQPVIPHQTLDFYHCTGRADVAKVLTMGAGDFFPHGNVG